MRDGLIADNHSVISWLGGFAGVGFLVRYGLMFLVRASASTRRSGPRPNGIRRRHPVDADTVHVGFDAETVHRFWLSLVSAHRAMSQFRAAREPRR